MVGTVLCTYLVLLIGLNIRPIRTLLVNQIEGNLSKALSTEIEIEDIEIGLFNRIVLQDVTIYDQEEEVLLRAKKFSAKILLRDLLKGRISLRSVLLMDADVCLYQTAPETLFNFQFILDQFKSSDDTSSETPLKIGSLIVTRANVTYDKKWLPCHHLGFDANHLAVTDIHTNLSFNLVNNDSIHLRVRKFSCNESCGFSIKNVRFNAHVNKNLVTIADPNISLPNTEIVADKPITINLSAKPYPIVNGDLRIKTLATRDFQHLDSRLQNVNLRFNGLVKAQMNDAHAEIAVNLKEKQQHFNLELHSSIQNHDNFNIRLDKLVADSVFLSTLTSLVTNDELRKIKNLGHVTILGNATYQKNASIGDAHVEIQSPVAGTVDIKIALQQQQLNLKLATTETDLKSLLESAMLPESLSSTTEFHATFKDSVLQPKHLAVNIQSVVNSNHYHLENLQSSVKIENDDIVCKIESSHPDLLLNLDAACTYRNKKFSNIRLDGTIQRLDFDNFGVSDSLLAGVWKGNIHLNLPTLTPQRCSLSLTIDSLVAQRKMQPFMVNRLETTLDYTKRKPSKFKLNSDIISVNAEGVIDYENVLKSWEAALMKNLPSTNFAQQPTLHDTENSMSFMVYLHNGQFAKNMFFIPIEVADGSSIQGKLHKDGAYAKLSAYTDRLVYDATELENVSLHLQSKDLNSGLLLQGRKRMFNDNVQFVVGAQLHDKLLETNVEWDGIHQHKFSGSLNTITSFPDKKTIRTAVLPTVIHLEDSVWNVSSGEILLTENSNKINNLTLNTAYQSITLNGGLSTTKDDSLHIALKNINVGDILEGINFRSVLFDGNASGDAYLSLTPDQPLLQTQLHVKSFLFNKALFGDADIHAIWNSPSERIDIESDFVHKDVSSTKASGYVWPAQNSIDLRITSNKTNVAFLRYWVNNIVKDISGNTTGFCRLYGTFSNLDLNGLMKVNAAFEVPANGVAYNINEAKVVITPGLFELDDASLTAVKGGTGSAKAKLQHQHFKHFVYDLNVNSDGLLLYDKPRSADMPFYATTYVNGNVQLAGSPSELNINVDGAPTRNSLIVYTESEVIGTSNSNDGVINFRDAGRQTTQDLTLPIPALIHAPQTDMRFRFNINMNPEATLRVLMDETTGDHLNLVGNGMLSAEYYNKGAFQLYGNYDLTGGNYQMSIQDVLKKNFEIQPGSAIIFGGNPDYAQLMLKAVYTVPAVSLADLNIGDNFSDRNIRANCILNIGGTASNPNVNFDLDLPNINEDEKQMVRKLLATEDDINMQVIHLLALGRFYTYDYTISEYNQQSQSMVVANSFLSSTLSSRVNDVIANALGTNDWNFGTNFTTGTSGWSDMEVDGIISGRLLNNRLHLNGNVGYHENQYNAMRGSNFVGDFDVKYQLTPAGGIFLKAYSETNDRYFTKSALTTQGLGIQFQKDFTRLRDIFMRTKGNTISSTTPDSLNELRPIIRRDSIQ